MSATPAALTPPTTRRLPTPLRWLQHHWPTIALIAITTLFMAPFFWVLSHSLESTSEWEHSGVTIWPAHTTLANYQEIIRLGFLRNVLASLAVASITTTITLLFSSLAGYAIARLPIRGRGLILGFVILAGFFPVMAMMGPMYLMFRNTGLLNTWWGVSIADLIYTLPLSTWLLASLLAQLPAEIEEAAMVDGCNRITALWRVIIPVAAPAITTAAIFSFILAWSDFAFSLSFLETPTRYTAPRAILFLGTSKFLTDYNLIDATVIITALPIFAIVLLAQRKIVTGLTAGAVK